MPRFSGPTFYYWSDVETEIHNTERHQIFRDELYRCASWDPKEFQIELADFAKRHPGLFKKKLENFYNVKPKKEFDEERKKLELKLEEGSE